MDLGSEIRDQEKAYSGSRIRNIAKFSITFRAMILNEAQVGSYVPAEQATFRIPDRILSRVSNRDSLQTNSSTVSLPHSSSQQGPP